MVCDLMLAPAHDFAVARNLCGAVAVCFMLYGLLWKAKPGERFGMDHD